MKKPMVITQGDAAGIGPEIIVKAWLEAPEVLAGCFVAGDVATLRRAAGWVQGEGVSVPVAQITTPAEAAAVPPRCIPVLQAVAVAGRDTAGEVAVADMAVAVEGR